MKPNSAHVVQDQTAVADFLGAPATHGQTEPVFRIDTHGAIVFLAEDTAYKIKRAVKFPYMDFSTLARRRQFCEREVTLNRRTAPDLYRGAVPITRQANGRLAIDSQGEAVEWAVVMRRFDQSGLLDRLAAAQALTPTMIRNAADAIVRFHMQAETLQGTAAKGGGRDGLAWVIEDNLEEMAERADLFPPTEIDRFATASRERLAACARILEARLVDGFVRRCHGDLHLRNICLIAGRPTIFDAIEFNDQLSCIDVLYDLAFLLMDLAHRNLEEFGNIVLNRYLQGFEQYDGLAALPAFQSARAAVRAKVLASAETSQHDRASRQRVRREAGAYFELAQRFLATQDPRLVAVAGLSGTGKTSLAKALAPQLGNAPGAIRLRSDVIRKQMCGVDELATLPVGAYSADMTTKVYNRLAIQAARVLAAGHSVIVDAVFLRPSERRQIETAARSCNAAFDGLWLDASENAMIARIEGRQADASDATVAVLKKQLALSSGQMTWPRLDAGGSKEAVHQQATARLSGR